MSRPNHQRQVMIIAGEASGDLHGSKLIRAMKRKDRHLSFAGIGGDACKAEGVRILVDAEALAVVGITEALVNARQLLGGISAAKRFLGSQRPVLLILIDFPDFNLRVARTAKKLGIPVLYYISPQIWAWRAGRVRKIKKRVNHMAVIFPFEVPFYQKAEMPVTFVGHPLLDEVGPPGRKAGEAPHPKDLTIGLLPGSRSGEIRRHLPAMTASVRIIADRMPGAKFMLSLASGIDRSFIDETVTTHARGVDIEIAAGNVSRVLDKCVLVVAASGTVTLEAAIAGVPMVVIYKLSHMSALLVRLLIRVKYVCLVNLIADRQIVPELLQADATPQNIAETAANILLDPARLGRMKRDLAGIWDKLGGPGASEKVAGLALEMIGSRKT